MSAEELLADLRAATEPGADGAPLMICLHGEHLSLVKTGVSGTRHVPMNLSFQGVGVGRIGRDILRQRLAASRAWLDAKEIRWENSTR